MPTACRQVDAAGTTKFTYTAAGNLLTEDGPWRNDTVAYTYHANVPSLRTGPVVAARPGRDAFHRVRFLSPSAHPL